jgi:hypothetical protein
MPDIEDVVAPENPHDILTQTVPWVMFEFEQGRGSLFDLNDFAKRFTLVHNMNADPAVSESVRAAFQFILKTDGECHKFPDRIYKRF